jgi:hypothetical protein
VPQFILSILAVIRVFFRSRSDTALEILALRQQVVLKRKRPRPTLNSLDRFFWTALHRFFLDFPVDRGLPLSACSIRCSSMRCKHPFKKSISRVC